MINGKYHKEAIVDGKKIIIDAAQIENIIEVMVMDGDAEEIDSVKCATESDAAIMFNRYVDRYAPKPLTGKYAKLRDDLKAAVQAGIKAIMEDPEDGGTCNFDSATIRLPRWDSRKVEQAAREAGTGAWLWTLWGVRRYVLTARGGQGNSRTRYAEAMHDSLKAAGYDAGMYYAMD